jgi:drug/metabolite transporter (DMT)-like permease
VTVLAELFIGFSIQGKNATLSGLIEISYPFFIAIFSYLLFRKNYLTLSTVFGGLFIAIGVFLIYRFN